MSNPGVCSRCKQECEHLVVVTDQPEIRDCLMCEVCLEKYNEETYSGRRHYVDWEFSEEREVMHKIATALLKNRDRLKRDEDTREALILALLTLKVKK